MLNEADQELIERVARRVVDLRMTVPAILLLEGARPLNFLASQTMLFFRPVIESVWASQDYGRFQELHLERGTDSQEVLHAVMARTRVRHFELAKPSLHDIFVRIAGSEAEEVTDAQDA